MDNDLFPGWSQLNFFIPEIFGNPDPAQDEMLDSRSTDGSYVDIVDSEDGGLFLSVTVSGKEQQDIPVPFMHCFVFLKLFYPQA